VPALLNHWRVLIETARRLGDRAAPLQAAPQPTLPAHLPGGNLSVWAYLGAIGPDVPYFTGAPFQRNSGHWADLMHYNRTGRFPIRLVEHATILEDEQARSAALAYALGYMTHIATDIATHPYVNSIAGAPGHQRLPHVFWGLGMHTYLELCMDELTAQTYFNDHSARLGHAPWDRYLPTAAQLDRTFIRWFGNAFAETYELNAEAERVLCRAYLSGFRQFCAFARSSSFYRLVFARLCVGRQRRLRLVDEKQADICLNLAAHISVRFATRALDYYETLRSGADTATQTTARAALRTDLRDWNLDTGMAPTISIVGDRVSVRYYHCWNHFATLLEETP